MKKILLVIMFTSIIGYCALAQKTTNDKESATATATYEEAMKTGMPASKAGRKAQLACYKARREHGYKDEEKNQYKIWISEHKKAATAFAEAVKLAKNDKQKCRALFEQSRAYFSINRKEAVELMKQAFEISPSDGNITYWLTWQMNQAGMPEESCKVAEDFFKDGNYKKRFAKDIIRDNYIPALLSCKRFDDARMINAKLVKIDSKSDRINFIKKAEAVAGK